MLSGPLLILAIIGAVLFVVLASSRWHVHPFISLLLASLGLALIVGLPLEGLPEVVNTGFGNLMAYIGLVVVLGSIIGVILERSGAALRLAEALLRGPLGRRYPTLAMSLVGAIVGIPVFCDSGFVILSSLSRRVARQAKRPEATLSLGLAGGLYTTHTLVPPTPGPIAAAGNLGIGGELGYLILLGSLVSIPVMLVVFLSARWRGEQITVSEQAALPPMPESLPALWHAALPIVLPLVLITGGTLSKLWGLQGNWANVLAFVGHPLLALSIGCLLAFTLFPAWKSEYVREWVGEGLKAAGPILILTGAGGVFGAVLKATPLRELLAERLGEGGMGGSLFLLAAFGIAAFLKSAQGSSTSALVITSSMLAPLAAAAGLADPYALSLLVLAIGGGAMTVSHANDSYFWVVSQFSGFSLADAYRSFSLQTMLQGLTVLLAVLLLSLGI